MKKEELSLVNKINDLDHKNTLLSSNLDLDYVETLIRERFLFGNKDETIYIIKKMTNKIRHPEKVNKPINPIKKNLSGSDQNLRIAKNFFPNKNNC